MLVHLRGRIGQVDGVIGQPATDGVDPSFGGGDGVVLTSIDPHVTYDGSGARDVHVLPTGAILVLGYELALWRKGLGSELQVPMNGTSEAGRSES